MRLWHLAVITALLALLYAPVFEPSLSVVPLLGYAALILSAFAVVDVALIGIAALAERRPSWLDLALVNAVMWGLAWII
jgi:hypothetical protein